VNTSPGKWQVSWRVEGFAKDEAEDLQRALARETGADPAATDCARVLRLPGFYNHKYDRPYLVRVEPHTALAGVIYRPEQFPKFPQQERSIWNPAGEEGQQRLGTTRGEPSHNPSGIGPSPDARWPVGSLRRP